MAKQMDLTANIFEAIKLQGGSATREQIQELLPETKHRSVNRALLREYERGKLNRSIPGNRTINGSPIYAYSINTSVPLTSEQREIRQAETQVTQPSPDKDLVTHIADMVIYTDKLEKEIEDLKAWQVKAIERHPDLAVPEIVLRARGIVAEIYTKLNDPAQATRARQGTLDNTPIMQATLTALEQ